MKKILTLILSLILFSCAEKKDLTVSELSEKTGIYFNSIKDDPSELKHFFTKMPKGGDIHHHSNGTPYAEEFIQNAINDSCYINPFTYQLYSNREKAILQGDTSAVLINTLLQNRPDKKDSIIDNWSVRNYKENNRDGHDLFFSTFTKFDPAFVGYESELLSEICRRAAADNISYLETMIAAPNINDSIAKFADAGQWDSDNRALLTKLADLYTHFKDNNISKWAKANADSLDNFYTRTNKHGIDLKFQTYGLRISANQPKIFGSLILAFETATLSENVVGVNFVAPEDNANALKNYSTHMQMFGFLHEKYPQVNISLHAGELVPGKGSVKESDLKFHINEALKTARAMRIGHGVDITGEDNYEEVLRFMNKNGRAVEINLESNEVILETNTKDHPINAYRKYNVPICISSDDEGVLRTNLINQYMLLIEYVPDISYEEIKSIVFNSIRYSFLVENDKSGVLKKLKSKFEEFEKEIVKDNDQSKNP
ncbi:hypothetical protein GWK08_16500 [Leptobacterium flavescens]|uniref:adenosine deaminase n=1 Tax=Leptobacterium flavescens TaxID=472055 RepID=A0A6P0UQ21_9FLAO|nr:hypothetical protein [Leptobacterium flavescens]NER15057.1 hypothetical protein [Leptobacterium flavescens]